MKVKKSIKKAQSGGDTTRAKNLVTERKMMPKFIDLERERVKGPMSDKIDTTARKKAIKEGYFTEDPKSSDLIPTAKYFADRKSGKKMPVSKNGASLKPVDSSKNPGLAKLPTPVRNKMGYQKDGGKTKAKSGAALKKQAAVAIAMKKAGKAPKKKMQYGGSAASMAPKKAMGGMKMMKGGGKCKYGC